jgi:transposase-like protein
MDSLGKEPTMSKKRTQYPPEFKAKVALAALRNEQTISELAAHYGIHPAMINQWKKALLEGASDIFDKGHKSRQKTEATVDELYRQIGQLKVERDFLSKKLSL